MWKINLKKLVAHLKIKILLKTDQLNSNNSFSIDVLTGQLTLIFKLTTQYILNYYTQSPCCTFETETNTCECSILLHFFMKL